MADFKKQVVSNGGKEASCKGWKVVLKEPAAKQSAGTANSPAKASPAKTKKTNLQYVNPEGKKFESLQSVLKHMGLLGMSRSEAFLKAQKYRQEKPCPFSVKLQQGQLTVQALGNLMVEKGPSEPTFHDKDNLYPIGFKAEFLDLETGTAFENSIQDGMDIFQEDIPGFQVRVLGETAGNKTFIDKKPSSVWKQVKAYLQEHGTDKEKEVAKGWSAITLHCRFGLASKEVRKRIEGLSGAADCFRYKFMEEASAAATGVKIGAENKNKKPKTSKSAVASAGDRSVDERDEGARKMAGDGGADADGDGGAEAFQKKKRPAPQMTGYKLYSKDVIVNVRKANPEATTGELVKTIKKMYGDLDELKRREYESKAESVRMKQAARNTSAAAGGVSDSVLTNEQNHEEKPAELEEDKTNWRSEGSEYIGKRVRRYVFDSRNRLIDAADGVVVGWLDKDESDYLAEATGVPAALWHMTYDDTRIGSEDLEEHEVVEAMELLTQELPEKVMARYLKRQEVIAVQQAKKKEKEEKAKAREDARMIKALKLEEKEALRKEREKLRAKFDSELSGRGEDKSALEPLKDEADVLIQSGKWKGIKASKVQIPAGSQEVFPPAALSDDFISIYTFLHDLSAPLGAAKMQLNDVLGCLVANADDEKPDSDEDGSVESFYEVAKWLTELASRGFWIRDSDEEVLEETRNRDVCDISLAAGPLLSATVNDATVKYSGWQLLNEASWPEIARTLLLRRSEVMRDASLVELCDTLGFMEPADLSVEQKVKLLRFLCDEASAGDRVHRVLNDKLKQIDRILDKKRVEDLALKVKTAGSRKGSKTKTSNGGESSEGAKEGDVAGGGEEVEVDAASSSRPGRNSDSRTCFEVMLFLAEQKPGSVFEIRHNGNTYQATIDRTGIVPRIRCSGKEYDTVSQWIKDTTGKTKFAAKLCVWYENEKLKHLEDKIEFPPDDKSKADANKEVSQVHALMSEVRDESLVNIDTDRRKREIQRALDRVKKGLRYEPIGEDRWHRTYWCFDGITDRVWVRGLPTTVAPVSASASQQPSSGSTKFVPEGCWSSDRDFGIDGLASEKFKQLGRDAGVGTAWVVYYKHDGTLQALVDMITSGPNGSREAALLAGLREHGVLEGVEGASKDTSDRVLPGTSSPTNNDTSADSEMVEADAKALRPRSSSNDKKEVAMEEDGYEWNELPSIGDLVWARLGEAHKRAWYPVVVVEPPADVMSSTADDREAETESDEDEEDEWQRTGSEYLGKRLLLEVPDRRGEPRTVSARIVGWLPKEVADFKNEATGEPAALWRAKVDDRKIDFEDLEEYEVKEGLLRMMRQEAKRKSAASEILSSTSMFGQSIKKVYTRLFNDDEDIEVLALSDLQPFSQFKEQHEQEMRRAGKTKALQQVKLANIYLEERGLSFDQHEERSELMRQLGIKMPSETADVKMPADIKAASQHCAHFPRILNVVQDNREAMPWITSTKELKIQLAAIHSKLLMSAQLHEKLTKKLTACKDKAEAAKTRAELVESIAELELVLHECALENKDCQGHMEVDLDEWRTEGHEFIDKRIRRPIKGSFGRVVNWSAAKIVGWLPADESDYKSEKTGEPAALWHVLWSDGAEEDLEEWEVLEALEQSAEEDDELAEFGIWSSGRDRKEWLALLSGCRTVGATALALYLLGDRALPMVATTCQALLHAAEESDDHCFVCFDGGKLLCCDRCPRTVHFQCVGLTRAPKEKDEFLCFHCQKDAKANPKGKGKGGAGSSKKKEEESSRSSRSKASNKGSKDEAPMPVDKLRKGLLRMGAVNGSIIEVSKEGVPLSVLTAGDRRPTREERYFAFVHDGDVVNKSSEPALKGVQFYPPFRARDHNKMRLQDGDKQIVEVSISTIIACGSVAKLLSGETRRGFVPADSG